MHRETKTPQTRLWEGFAEFFRVAFSGDISFDFGFSERFVSRVQKDDPAVIRLAGGFQTCRRFLKTKRGGTYHAQ